MTWLPENMSKHTNSSIFANERICFLLLFTDTFVYSVQLSTFIRVYLYYDFHNYFHIALLSIIIIIIFTCVSRKFTYITTNFEYFKEKYLETEEKN